MEKIVNIKERIESKNKRRKLERHRGKIAAIQKFTQCSSCDLRCAMCGHHIKVQDSSYNSPSSRFKFKFCEDCRGEFEEFLSISRGKKDPDVFWYNKEWISMWSAWLNYRQAIDRFLNSSEFKLLFEELDRHS